MTDRNRLKGASNVKAKGGLGWGLLYPKWRGGFTLGLVDPPVQLPAATR